MSARNSKRRLNAEMNVVPYIDVMLVLLIIFMITAPLLTTGVKVNLPDARANPTEYGPNNEPLILTVKADGDYYLSVGENPEAPIDADAVRRLASIFMEKQPKAPVVVKGAAKADYGDVVRGMVLLQQAGADQVGLLTDHQPGDDED